MLRKLSSKLFFRIWYLRKPPWDSGISPPELMEFIEQHQAGRALDLGCGTATNVITLAQHGWQVTGIDFVPKAIRQGQRKAKGAGVQAKLIIGDVSDRTIMDGPYDLVLDMGCYHSLTAEQRARYRQNVAEVLAPGGTYMLYAFTLREGDTQRSHITEDEVEAFSRSLELRRREDGSDRGEVTSSWFWFEKPEIGA